MKKLAPLILVLLLLVGCSGNYAVNPLFGVCLMANDSLYVCNSAVADGELPEGLEGIGSIKDFGSCLPESNFEATSNDFGSELFAIPGDISKVYSYSSDKEQHWLFLRCEFGVVLGGTLYIPDAGSGCAITYVSKLPDGFTSAGTARAVEAGMPSAEFESFGLPEGAELFTGSDREQYIYVGTGSADISKYLRLEPFIPVAINE